MSGYRSPSHNALPFSQRTRCLHVERQPRGAQVVAPFDGLHVQQPGAAGRLPWEGPTTTPDVSFPDTSARIRQVTQKATIWAVGGGDDLEPLRPDAAWLLGHPTLVVGAIYISAVM